MLEVVFALLGFAHATDSRSSVRAIVGASYDSRILIAPDSMFDQGQPTNFGDYRLVTNGEFTYWAVARRRHHWGPAAALALTNTAKNQHAAGDPYRANFSLPYLLDFDAGRPHQLLVRPTYQTLLMDPALTSRKMIVQNSLMLDVDNLWHVDRRWDLGFGLQYRRDDATTRQSVGPNDADADKFTARGRATFYPADHRRHALAFDVGIIRNQARGQNARYDRREGGVTFTGPLGADRTYALGAGLYQLNFPATDSRRTDLNVNVSAGARVPLGGPWAIEFDARYARNSARTAAYRYDRTSVLTALTLDQMF